MAKKIDIANEIVEEFPDQGFDPNQLVETYTEKDLVNLQQSLREGQAPETAPVEEPESPTEDLGIEQTEETEQSVEEIVKALGEGKKVSGKFRLASPRTQYADGNFTLAGEQEKELPKEPSLNLIERIRSGFIIKA